MSKNWYIVTNTENLTHFIDYGLIIDEQGFAGTSYIADAMRNVPKGYIPCFAEDNLSAALKKAKEEDPNLSCCCLELDFNKITNLVTWGGSLTNMNSAANQKQGTKEELLSDKNINCILLSAPLPTSIIKSIFLKDSKIKSALEASFSEKNSTKTSLFKVKSSLFKDDKATDDGSQQPLKELTEDWKPESIRLNYHKFFSYGGALGLLYYQTKNGQQSTGIFKYFSGFLLSDSNDFKSENIDNLKLIEPYYNYFFNSSSIKSDISRIYELIVDKLLTSDSYGENCQSILNVLKNVEISESYNNKCNGLSIGLEKIVERTIDIDPESILRKIIEKYEGDVEFKNFALLLTMFFLRDHVETMLKYYYREFTEINYSLLAIFFGMTCGIENIPDEIRQNYELSPWLSYKMAKYAHNIDEGNTVEFKEPPKPLLLYGDIIRSKPTKIHIVYKLYEWLDKKFKKTTNLSLIETIQKPPKEGRIENGDVISDGLPDIRLAIKTELLESYIQQQIKEDTLFDFKEIIDAYKK